MLRTIYNNLFELKPAEPRIIPNLTQEEIQYELRHTELQKPRGYKSSQSSSLRLNDGY